MREGLRREGDERPGIDAAGQPGGRRARGAEAVGERLRRKRGQRAHAFHPHRGEPARHLGGQVERLERQRGERPRPLARRRPRPLPAGVAGQRERHPLAVGHRQPPLESHVAAEAERPLRQRPLRRLRLAAGEASAGGVEEHRVGMRHLDHGGEGEERLGERAQRRPVGGGVERHGLEPGAGRPRLHQRVARPDPGGERRGGGVAHRPLRHHRERPGGRARPEHPLQGQRRDDDGEDARRSPLRRHGRPRGRASRSIRIAAGMAGSPGPESRSAAAPPFSAAARSRRSIASARDAGTPRRGTSMATAGKAPLASRISAAQRPGSSAPSAGSGRTMRRRARSTPSASAAGG